MRRLILGLLLVFIGLPVFCSLSAILFVQRSTMPIRTAEEAAIVARDLHMRSRGLDPEARAEIQRTGKNARETYHLAKTKTASFPLIEAARNGQDGTVDQLLKRNVDPNGHDQDNRTALHYAAQGGHAYIAEQLVRHGANLYALDNQGRTPLHLAAMQGHSDMVKTLLRLGANQEIRDSSGLRPVDYALRGGHQQTAASFAIMPSNTPVMRTAVLPAAAWAMVSIRLLLFLIMPLVLLLSFILVLRRRPRPVPLRPDHDRLQQMTRLAERMEARIANLETILTPQPDRQTTHTRG